MFLLPPLIENTKRVEIIQGYEEMQFLNTWLSITKNSNRNRKKKEIKRLILNASQNTEVITFFSLQGIFGFVIFRLN